MKALILVDIQNDFCPGGALAVSHGDDVVAIANRLQPAFDLVVATQDWHPSDHGSFAAHHDGRAPGQVIDLFGLEQVLWPTHCVQGSSGAAFHPDLSTDKIEAIFRKGTDPTVDSYSGFFDNGKRKRTGLAGFLRERGVDEIFVCGLATDYCVKFTALDAVNEGFAAILIEDACRGVELAAGDVERAVADMRAAGIAITTSSAVLA